MTNTFATIAAERGAASHHLPAVAAAIAILAALAPARPATAAKICAFSIPVEMVDNVDSKTARSGGIFRFRVTQPTQLDVATTIPKGTVGYGVVRSSDAAGRHNHDGSLSIEPRYLALAAPRQRELEVTMNPTLPAVWTPSEPLLQKAASHVPLPVPGLAMGAINAVRFGRNVTLGPGFSFTVLPVGNLSRGPVC